MSVNRPTRRELITDLVNACEVAVATIRRLNRHDSANGTLDVLLAAIAAASPLTANKKRTP